MPLNCFGNHDWTDPVIQRSQRGRVTIVKLVKTCLACGEEREVSAPAPRLPIAERIKSYEL